MDITFRDFIIGDFEGKVELYGGLWCNLHIILMVLLAVWLIACAIWFYKRPAFARKFCYMLCWVMIISRVVRMAVLFIVRGDSFVEILPWHLCHILAFVFPLYYFTRAKFFALPVLLLTFFGGILTFVFGDYYKYAMMSFLDIESIGLHFMMPTVVIGALAGGVLKLNLKQVWEIPIALAVLVGYACLGNWLVPCANFMYLKSNGLPFDLFPGHSHLYTYAVVAAILITAFLIPFIIAAIVKKRKQKRATNLQAHYLYGREPKNAK